MSKNLSMPQACSKSFDNRKLEKFLFQSLTNQIWNAELKKVILLKSSILCLFNRFFSLTNINLFSSDYYFNGINCQHRIMIAVSLKVNNYILIFWMIKILTRCKWMFSFFCRFIKSILNKKNNFPWRSYFYHLFLRHFCIFLELTTSAEFFFCWTHSLSHLNCLFSYNSASESTSCTFYAIIS